MFRHCKVILPNKESQHVKKRNFDLNLGIKSGTDLETSDSSHHFYDINYLENTQQNLN